MGFSFFWMLIHPQSSQLRNPGLPSLIVSASTVGAVHNKTRKLHII